jgi:hypothetical protein
MEKTDFTNEEWRDITSYNGIFYGHYQVSSHGRVRGLSERRTHDNGIMKLKTTKQGYKWIGLSVRKEHGLKSRVISIGVARLVAFEFVPNPNDYTEIDHIDHSKDWNHYTNLQWIEHDKNCRRSQAYVYKVWFKDNPEDVYQFNSRRSVEIFIEERLNRPTHINVSYIIKKRQGKYSKDGFAITSERLTGKQLFRQQKRSN